MNESFTSRPCLQISVSFFCQQSLRISDSFICRIRVFGSFFTIFGSVIRSSAGYESLDPFSRFVQNERIVHDRHITSARLTVNSPLEFTSRGKLTCARLTVNSWNRLCVAMVWLAPDCSGRGTPAPNSSHHPLHKSLVCSSLRRQIIPSSPNLHVPYRSASHPRLVLDLPAS
ncbi:unnamed protein product [Pleuronectes platessa]|uniref:Uncharacterized protein n=1 Tax=Pleuronectes platessa TaxID=8262 RepID=A0A9N7VMY4_PLEPL|nr:unnamed protein product [Pleuronectes platessa]